MSIGRAARFFRVVFTLPVLVSGPVAVTGCGGGETTQTGTPVKEDTEALKQSQKEMEDYMKSQGKQKK